MNRRHEPQPIYEEHIRTVRERTLKGWRQKCEVCHVRFESKRADKLTCSLRCQKALQRQHAANAQDTGNP